MSLDQPIPSPRRRLPNIDNPVGKRQKPEKPGPDFPLFAHAAGVWAKKIRGKLEYFGPWSDPEGALARYLEQRDDLEAGRTPRPAANALPTVKDAANAFLNAKQAAVQSGELSPRSFEGYKAGADLVVATFGKNRQVLDLRGEDFAKLRDVMTGRWGPLRVAYMIR